MFLFGNQNRKHIRKLLKRGDLVAACELARQSDCLRQERGLKTARKLVQALITSANQRSADDDVAGAWRDLSRAREIWPEPFSDAVAREQTQLIESTIAEADTALSAGNIESSLDLIGMLRRRDIADRRADQIEQVARLVADSDALADTGKWREARERLQLARARRSDLDFIENRLEQCEQNHIRLKQLTSDLKNALLESNWESAAQTAGSMLTLSPRHPVALDATRQCQAHHPALASASNAGVYASHHQASLHSIGFEDPSRAGMAATDHPIPSEATAWSGIAFVDDANELATRDSLKRPPAQPNTVGPVTSDTQRGSTFARRKPIQPGEKSIPDSVTDVAGVGTFMLWLDGVGGFLVCTRDDVIIGRAVDQPEVDIPIQGDLRRKQVRISRWGDHYAMERLDQHAAGRGETDAGVAPKPELLSHGDRIDIGGGVQAQITLPNPLGRSARLDLLSRHRTEPWSDAIILLGDAALIGPRTGHHVRTTSLTKELMIFRRGNDILIRPPGPCERDGEPVAGDVVIDGDLRLVGDTWSLGVDVVRSSVK